MRKGPDVRGKTQTEAERKYRSDQGKEKMTEIKKTGERVRKERKLIKDEDNECRGSV